MPTELNSKPAAGGPLAAAPLALLWMRAALVVAVVACLLVVHHYGLFALFAEPAQLKKALVDLGPWGHVAFVVSYALLQPFGVPGTVFVFAAPLIWPWPVAYALSMVGTMAASVIGFSFARFLARDWLAQKVPPRLAAYSQALAERGFVTVVLLRLVLWMPQVLHTFLGVSQVGFWTHFWGSLLGYALPLWLTAYFGEQLFDRMRQISLTQWLALGAATLGVALLVWLLRRRRPG